MSLLAAISAVSAVCSATPRRRNASRPAARRSFQQGRSIRGAVSNRTIVKTSAFFNFNKNKNSYSKHLCCLFGLSANHGDAGTDDEKPLAFTADLQESLGSPGVHPINLSIETMQTREVVPETSTRRRTWSSTSTTWACWPLRWSSLTC